MRTALGRLLKDHREALGFSRARVSDQTGLSTGTLEGWEQGRVAKPPIHDVLRYANFLRVPQDALYAAVEADNGPPDADVRLEPATDVESLPVLLSELMTMLGWSDADAATTLGTTAAKIHAWRHGDAIIETTAMAALALRAALLALRESRIDLDAEASEAIADR